MTTLIGALPTATLASADITAGKGHKLGSRYTDHNSNEFVFVKASAAIAQYDAVTYDETYQTVVAPVSTSNDAGGDKVGVAPVAFASGEYGWLQIYGAGTVNALASCAANVRLNSTATAGSLDDDGTAGSFAIDGIVLTAARGGSAPTACVLNYPITRVPVL